MSRKQLSKEKKAINIRNQRTLAIFLVVLIVSAAMIIPLVVISSPGKGVRSFSSRYEVGSLANEDVFAFSSFEYEDVEQTERLLAKAEEKVL
ncbi:MAG: hypothetical protein PHR69_07305, partial [Sphaerochaeta sp.]|nr:hypothetical protein [Sphaerochaeta sp.]